MSASSSSPKHVLNVKKVAAGRQAGWSDPRKPGSTNPYLEAAAKEYAQRMTQVRDDYVAHVYGSPKKDKKPTLWERFMTWMRR